MRLTSLFAFPSAASAFISTVLLVSTPAFSGSLSGTVRDTSGALVAGGTVRVWHDSGFDRTVRASDRGEYRMETPGAGVYLIEARSSDRALSTSLRRELTAADNQVDLTLDVNALSERVTVTASNAPQSYDEVAKAVTVIGAQEMAARQQYNIADALRLTPGLRVQTLGGPGSFTRILTRGLRAPDTAILIDGVRFRDSAAVQGDAVGFLGDFLVINTDRVEVLRGSGSSLYGTNATGAAINIVSDQGGGPLHGEISIDGGGLGLARGVAKIGGGLGKEDRFRYSAGLGHLNVSRGVDGDDRVRNTSGQAWAQYVFSPATRVSYRFFGNDNFLGINNNPASVAVAQLPTATVVRAIPNVTFIPNVNDPDRRRSSNWLSSLVMLDQRLGARAGLRVNYQALRTNRDDVNGPAGAGFQPGFRTATEFNGQIDTANARLDLTISRNHSFTAGYEWERERFVSPAFDENPVIARRTNVEASGVQRSHAAYFQDQTRFFRDRLLVSLSGRFQNFALDRPAFRGGTSIYQTAAITAPPDALTGDAALAWMIPSTNTKLRAHAGNAYRAPSLYERFGTFFFGGSFSGIGDPRLRPDRSIGVDGGIDQYLFSNRVRLSGTYFYTRLQEVIAFGNLRNDPFQRFSGYVNAGGGLARGVELSVEARPSRQLTLQSSYTYTNADERRSSLIGGSLRVIRVFPHTFTFLAMQQVTKRWNVTFDFLAASDYLSGSFFVGGGSRPFEFAGPRRGNLASTYVVPLTDRVNMQIFTRIENVFNQEYFEDGFRTPKAWAVAGVKFVY